MTITIHFTMLLRCVRGHAYYKWNTVGLIYGHCPYSLPLQFVPQDIKCYKSPVQVETDRLHRHYKNQRCFSVWGFNAGHFCPFHPKMSATCKWTTHVLLQHVSRPKVNFFHAVLSRVRNDTVHVWMKIRVQMKRLILSTGNHNIFPHVRCTFRKTEKWKNFVSRKLSHVTLKVCHTFFCKAIAVSVEKCHSESWLYQWS